MSGTLAALREMVTRLSTAERAELALELIQSLDSTEIDVGAEEAWRIEVERRAAEIDRGEVEPIPGDEVFRRVRAKLG
jgi:putative addiction module component (TIGR02574 family)